MSLSNTAFQSCEAGPSNCQAVAAAGQNRSTVDLTPKVFQQHRAAQMLDHQHRGQWNGPCPACMFKIRGEPIKVYLGSPAYVGCQTLGKRPPFTLMKSGGACKIKRSPQSTSASPKRGKDYMHAGRLQHSQLRVRIACIRPPFLEIART